MQRLADGRILVSPQQMERLKRDITPTGIMCSKCNKMIMSIGKEAQMILGLCEFECGCNKFEPAEAGEEK